MVSVHKNSLIARHAGQKQYCVHGGRADLSKFQFEEPNIFSWKHFERSESDARICKVDLFPTSGCRCSTTVIVSYATIGFMHGSCGSTPRVRATYAWSKRGNSQAWTSDHVWKTSPQKPARFEIALICRAGGDCATTWIILVGSSMVKSRESTVRIRLNQVWWCYKVI